MPLAPELRLCSDRNFILSYNCFLFGHEILGFNQRDTRGFSGPNKDDS